LLELQAYRIAKRRPLRAIVAPLTSMSQLLAPSRAEGRTRVAPPRLVSVPGGRFLMGSEHGRDDERPVHHVELAPFAIGRTPVTCAEYAPFLAAGLADPPPWWRAASFCAPEQPVVGVTWWDATAYAGWLSSCDGGTWRLPTEAEWERAARGGFESAPTAWGDALPDGEVPTGPLEGPWPVGRGTPNSFGMMDAGTIVHEWCLDVYRADAYRPAGLAQPSSPGRPLRRSSRGGSWRHRVRFSPPSARSSLPPGFRYADYGFRVVREAA
jgi:formylglycine-generating enzyme required for sulfatase activity